MQQHYEQIESDLFRTVRLNKAHIIWMGFLTVALLICLYAYSLQLRDGLGVAGIRDYISWGMYISNFVFFVASSLIGMLISAVLGLIGVKWIKPLSRIAEIIALAFAAVAGLVIISDMGRPERLPYVFLYGRFQSPILWDVTVVTTYVLISALLVYLPLIPDLAIGSRRIEKPTWLRKIYELLSVNWQGTPAQYEIIHRSVRILLILIVPVALAIHTVTSWLFASTSRVGWNSTIFGPYFVSGAFVAGIASVIIAMYFFRKNYKLEKYITLDHFDKVGKLLVLICLVYLYFNINEFLVPAYKMERGDLLHLEGLFVGHNAGYFWFAQIFGLLLPIILLLFKKMRTPLPMLLMAIMLFLASWVKRYIIVVPTQEHPFLPIQHVPANFLIYKPTLIETGITIASFLLVLIIITLLSKLFPVIPVWEMKEEAEHSESKTV
jgi:molybdopterin-containing oxidoreductase family membrane subunit